MVCSKMLSKQAKASELLPQLQAGRGCCQPAAACNMPLCLQADPRRTPCMVPKQAWPCRGLRNMQGSARV